MKLGGKSLPGQFSSPQAEGGRRTFTACMCKVYFRCPTVMLSFLDGSYLLLWGAPAAATNLLSEISCPTPSHHSLWAKSNQAPDEGSVHPSTAKQAPKDQGHPRHLRDPPSRMERVPGATASVLSPDCSIPLWYCSPDINF